MRKLSQRQKQMYRPGLRDNDVLPQGGAMNSGITLDYSAIQRGGMDMDLPYNEADDFYGKADWMDWDAQKGRHGMDNEMWYEILNDLIPLSKTKDESAVWAWIKSLQVRMGIPPKHFSELKKIVDEFRAKNYPELKNYNEVEEAPAELLLFLRLHSKTDPEWIKQNQHKPFTAAEDYNEADDMTDPYNDNNSGRGSFVGSKEEGSELKLYMGATRTDKLIAFSFPNYPELSDPANHSQIVGEGDYYATPHFDLFNTYFAEDGGYEVEEADELEKLYPRAGKVVDGREVRSDIPNYSSISVSIPNHTVLSGIREVQLSLFSSSPMRTGRILQLANDIKNSNEISPLIVVVDGKPNQPYVLEGYHRFDALQLLGAKSFPAVVVIDEDEISKQASILKTATLNGRRKVMFVKADLTTKEVVCDHADTYQKQVIGLQNHSSLRPDQGMLFTYASPSPVSFHMGVVKFPIDIVFADNNNTILKVYRNCLPNSREIYSCSNASKVIEVVGSFCTYHDIDVGDKVFNADDADDNYTQHILEKVRDIKIAQQKDLGMTDWSIKVVMKATPDSRRFLRVSWSPQDYLLKKADIFINPDPALINEALKEMPLEKLVRHSLLHILTGHKNELPEDKENKIITPLLFKEQRNKQLQTTLIKRASINKNG